jgi:hypothetical protein
MAFEGHEYAFHPIQRNVSYLTAKETVAERAKDRRRHLAGYRDSAQ